LRPSRPALNVRDAAYAPRFECGTAAKEHNFRKNESEIFFAKGLDTNSPESLVGQISSGQRQAFLP
jgi:hypothetical protein